SPTAGNATLVEQPFMFTGRRWDFEEGSGLYYYRLRYYDPVVGRFVQRDPLGMWGDPAQHGSGQSYCGSDPVNWVDPFGLNTPSGVDLGRALSDDPMTRAMGEGFRQAAEEAGASLDELEGELRGAASAVAEGRLRDLIDQLLDAFDPLGAFREAGDLA